jgi:hypothetical protein
MNQPEESKNKPEDEARGVAGIKYELNVRP